MEQQPNPEQTKREALTIEVEKTRLQLVNLQSRAYELREELEAIETQILPVRASYQTAMNVLNETAKDLKAAAKEPDKDQKAEGPAKE